MGLVLVEEMITERSKIIREMDAKYNILCAKKVQEARIVAFKEVLDTIEQLQKRGWEKGSILDSVIGKLFGDSQKGSK